MIKPIQEPLILNPIKAKNVNEQENYKTLYIFVFQHFPGEKIKQMKASQNIFLHCLHKFLSEPIQGDPNQNLKSLLAITLKLCISDPRLVKPKCVLGAYVYF